MQCITLSATHSLRNVYIFPLLILVGPGSDSIVWGSLSNAVSRPVLDITWEVDGSMSEHWLRFSDGSGLSLTFLTKKLSIVLFIFSHHLRLHPLCLSDWPRLLTSLCLAAAHTFSNVNTHTGISGPRPIRGGGGSAPSLSLIRPRYVPNVCLLLNSRETFRVVEPFFLSKSWSHRCNLRLLLVAPLRN